jgi:hypothetical protein
MFGAESTRIWWRRPVLLAGAAGLVTGVVIGGAGHSLPASSTHPIGPAAAPRVTVTVTAAAPTATRTRTVTVTEQATPAATPSVAPVASRPPASTGAPSGPVPVAPASSEPVQIDPVALCKDGTLSYAVHHEGACAHHGGVAIWYR